VTTLRVQAGRHVDAPPALVYECLADMQRHHARFLPEAFSDFEVVSGGVGEGTVIRYRLTAGGRTRRYEMAVTEPEPGRVLRESDAGSSLATTFTVDPDGAGSQVTFETTWQGAGGVGGFFEALFAPRVMRRIYVDELGRLDAYARGRAAGEGGEG